MTTKKQMIEDPNSCLNKAADDEPIFVLRAQDELSSWLVDLWATKVAHWSQYAAQDKREAVLEKARAANAVADAMRCWPNRKMPD